MITETRLAEIEARSAAATAGPWNINCWSSAVGEALTAVDAVTPYAMVVCPTNNTPTITDATFIAHARTDIDDLCAELRAAWELIENIAASEQFRMWQACPDCDYPDKCEARKACNVQSKAEKMAKAFLAARAGKRGG